MKTLFTFKTPLNEMHQYPVGVNHQYCFEPEIFKLGLKGLHQIERTFLKDNQQFWREVVKANVEQIRLWRRYMKSLCQIIQSGESLSPDQSSFYERVKNELNNHEKALRIARKRSLTGFGLESTKDVYAKRLRSFYTRLVTWEHVSENNVFRGNVVEDALGIVQKAIYHTEPYEACCGIHNGPLLKGILADINTNDEYRWLYNLAVFTECLSERLALLVKGSGYEAPTFKMEKHFYD